MYPFFETNVWIQLVFALVLLSVGIFWISPFKFSFLLPVPRVQNDVLKGVILSTVNPPVFIFWILGISLTQKYILSISATSTDVILFAFFKGVFVGK